ncbi:MAG TPA: ABC transporter permease [Thermoanaerobaculia bacterium]|nr:ABC transporter permease [Thermoanaerobaculia bacterium]
MIDLSRLAATFRGLLRRPGYTLAAVLTLAVGIGASTAVFSLLYGSLLRPLPYPEADRLIRVHNAYAATGGGGPFATPNYLDLAAGNRTLDELVGYQVKSVNLATEAAPERVRSLAVTANFFAGLGVAPALGRGFEAGEDRAAAPRVAVISDRLWRDRFAGRSQALGETLRLNGDLYTVVGVLPASFWFPGEAEIVVPFAWSEEDLADGRRGHRWLAAFGRLQPGVGESAAQQDLAALTDRIAATFPDNNEGWTVDTMPFEEFALGRSRASLWLLTGAVALVLLIGCVNVANLMLVASERRRREVALRAALGAGWQRLAAGHLAEGLALSSLAAVVGLGLAYAGMRLALGLYGDALPRAGAIELNLPVALVAVGLALVTGVAVGLVPALRLDVGALQEELARGGRGNARGSSRLQKVLVGAEVAVAVVLAAGAGLLVHSFWNLHEVDSGVEPAGAMVFRLELPAASYPEPERVSAFYDRALDEIGRLPAVEQVGISPRVPLQGGMNITSLPSPDDPEVEAAFVEIRQVSPGFFAAAGIPLRRGRLLGAADASADDDVVVISEELAATLFPEGDALGKRILRHWNEVGYEVVGVVGGVREFGVGGEKRPAVYWLYPALDATTAMTFVVRTRGDDPLRVVPEIRNVLASLDPTLPIYELRTMDDVVIETIGNRWFATTLFSIFGALALALAACGIFGVLAYVVEQRSREIGVRMALGATRAGVTRLVVGEMVRLVAGGLVVGVAVALAASRLLADLLYEVAPYDPATLATVALVALAVAALAAWLPVRRATGLEPTVALRQE